MDEKNLYNNDNTESAFEQAARQQAALQEEQAQLREAQQPPVQSLMKEEALSPQPILKEESVPPQPVQEPVMEAETQPSVVQKRVLLIKYRYVTAGRFRKTRRSRIAAFRRRASGCSRHIMRRSHRTMCRILLKRKGKPENGS